MDRENSGASLIRSLTPTASRSNHKLITPDSSVRGKNFTGTAAGRPSISAIQRNFCPVTPANSPASQEIPPRKMRASFDKENEKDRTASGSVRTQSPVTSKGTKNFMAPTISAASKVAASPKTKVLSEINEMVRSPVSLSDVKSSVTSMNSLVSSGTEKACRKPEISSVSLSMPANSQIAKHLTSGDQIHRAPVSLPNGNFPLVSEELSDISETERGRPKLENEVGSGFQSDDPKSSLYGESPESVTPDNSKVTEPLEPKFSQPVYNDNRLNPKEDNFCSLASPRISSSPSYDPKTNYLSPRPRFLHYRPKSRIEICLSTENYSHSDKGIKLEESFSSESSSDTEKAAVQTPKDSEESFSHDEDAEVYEETRVSRPISECSNGCIQRSFGSYFYGERKVKLVLLAFVIACLSMSIKDSPGIVISSYLPKAYFSNQLFAPADENLEWASHSFKQWSVSYWSEASIFSKKEKTDKFQFSNFTSLDLEICSLLDIMATENPANFFPGVQFKETDKKSRTGLEREEQILEDFTEAKLHETREDSKDHRGSSLVEEDKIEQNSKSEEVHSFYGVAEAMQSQIGTELESEGKNKEDTADHVVDDGKEVAEEVVEIVLHAEAQDEEDLLRHESTKNIDEEIADAALEAVQLSSQIGNESQENITSDYHTYIESESTPEEAISGKLDCFSTFHAGNKLWVHIALTLFAFLALVAVSSTIYIKHTKVSAVHPTVLKQNCPSEKVISKGDSDLKGSRKSEMSSSVRNSSSNSRWKQIEKIHSIERKVRRNSLVSDCSAESPSLGSFTTYEMLQVKHGCEENDALTPVRRSGRIRKRITLPPDYFN